MRKLFLLIIALLTNQIVHAQWTTSSTNLYPTNYSTMNIGLGTSAPTKRLEVVGYGSTSATPVIIRNDFVNELAMYSNSDVATHRSQLSLFKSRGTYATPTAISSGDYIGSVAGNPYINGAFRAGASMDFYSGANPSATSYPVNIQFSTTGNGQTTRAERMRITEDGNVGIGTSTPGSAYKLDVNGYINATGLYVNNTLFTGTSQWTTSGTNINYNAAGVVSIGTIKTPAGYKLAVGGKMVAEEVVIMMQGSWPDYVFAPTYKLPTLSELETYIKINNHLPGVPTAINVKEDGVSVGEMNAILLKKIEELTLYVIELKKENEDIKSKISNFDKK